MNYEIAKVQCPIKDKVITFYLNHLGETQEETFDFAPDATDEEIEKEFKEWVCNQLDPWWEPAEEEKFDDNR